MTSRQPIAIVGAGLAGLVCARRLTAAGFEVHLFDKSRGAGGRLCTRRHDNRRFDHGAQYFTATELTFQNDVDAWARAGVVAQWSGRFGRWHAGTLQPDSDPRPRWVAQPRMSALGRYLSQNLDVRLQARIVELEAKTAGWSLATESGDQFIGYQAVLLSCPGPQVQALLPGGLSVAPRVASLNYAPCWAVMVEFSAPVPCPFDGVRFSEHPLGWVARDSSKPGRDEGERWVLHGSPQWSTTHLEKENTWVEKILLESFQPFASSTPLAVLSHRWRYALASVDSPTGAIWDARSAVGVFGDAFVAPKVEGAWSSGVAMAESFLAAHA